jgi:hypothetical protein
LCLVKRYDGESSNQRVPNTVVEFQCRTFGVTVFSSFAGKQVCYLHSLEAKIMQNSLIGVTRSTGMYRKKILCPCPERIRGNTRVVPLILNLVGQDLWLVYRLITGWTLQDRIPESASVSTPPRALDPTQPCIKWAPVLSAGGTAVGTCCWPPILI